MWQELPIAYNGPAIKGGCVTWRSHPATGPGTPSTRGQKIVPVARQVWRAFCHHGRNFIELRRGRGTSLISSREIVPVDEVGRRALAQHRGTSLIGGRYLSRCRILIDGSCASPGAGVTTGPGKWLRIMQKA